MRVVWVMPNPRLNKTISHLPGVKAAVAIEAEEIYVRAKARLWTHKPGKDGLFGPSRVTISHGRVDSFVNLQDPEAAGAISQNLNILWGAAGLL